MRCAIVPWFFFVANLWSVAMRWVILFLVVAMGGPLSLAAGDKDDTAEIKALIPAATAMSRQDFDKLARSPEAPTVEQAEEKSLTLLLMTLKPLDEPQATEAFSYVGMPQPAKLAREVSREGIAIGAFRMPTGPTTMIHADRITQFTCDVQGNRATGTVTFQVPTLYQGKVDYVAARADGKWAISELAVPAYKIRLIRDKDGKWATK